jgi:hypothetical protein
MSVLSPMVFTSFTLFPTEIPQYSKWLYPNDESLIQHPFVEFHKKEARMGLFFMELFQNN